MTSKPGKQLQYTYCPISQEVKETRQFAQLVAYNMKHFSWKTKHKMR